MGVGKPANVETEIEGDILTIKINLRREIGLSRSKKNILVATTSGNMKIKEGVYLGLNVYKNGSRVTPFFRFNKTPRLKRRTKAGEKRKVDKEA